MSASLRSWICSRLGMAAAAEVDPGAAVTVEVMPKRLGVVAADAIGPGCNLEAEVWKAGWGWGLPMTLEGVAADGEVGESAGGGGGQFGDKPDAAVYAEAGGGGGGKKRKGAIGAGKKPNSVAVVGRKTDAKVGKGTGAVAMGATWSGFGIDAYRIGEEEDGNRCLDLLREARSRVERVGSKLGGDWRLIPIVRILLGSDELG